MSHSILNKLFCLDPTARRLNSKSRRRSLRRAINIEALESREVLSATTYVDDTWAFVSDEDTSSSVSIGDLVNDANSGTGSNAGSYGETAFGVVSSGARTGYVAGKSTINDAIDATPDGGTVRVLHYSASTSVAVDEPVELVGGFTISSGSLTMTNAGGAIVPGANGEAGAITLSAGNLDLDAGTLAIQLESNGTVDVINVNGAVDIDPAVKLSVASGNIGTGGPSFTIIDNDSNDVVGGTFAGLPQGGSFTVGDRTFTISYTGGTGNDVVITRGSVMPFTTYVDYDWAPVGGGTLDPGDDVTNANDDGDDAGDIATRYLANYSAGNNFYSAGYDTVTAAVSAVAAGGSVVVLQGPVTGFNESVTLSKRVVLQGSFILNGDLTVGSEATLLPSRHLGTLSVEDLSFSSGAKLIMTVGSAGDSDLIDVNGTIDLGSASLDLSQTGADQYDRQDILLIDNDSTDAVTGTFAGLPQGSAITLDGQLYWINYSGGSGNDVVLVVPSTTVVDRKLFYNQSSFDGNSASITTSDDNAIATDKTAYLPDAVNTATFDKAVFNNVSSFSRGINGIMVDLSNADTSISANDFYFRVGNNNSPGTWSAAPAPAAISVRAGAGVSGSDRVEITWASGDISNEWLEITVLSTLKTGLPAPDVFYFGSRVGDVGTGTPSSSFVTSGADSTAVSGNLGSGVGITSPYDFNRDNNVTGADVTITNGSTGSTTRLAVRTAPTIQEFSGPTDWVAGQPAAFFASPPMLDGGTPDDISDDVVDSTVDRVDFYQDVNGNGIVDAVDLLLAEGTELLDDNDVFMGWQGTFDPADLASGAAAILAVPITGTGFTGTPHRGPIFKVPSPPAPPAPTGAPNAYFAYYSGIPNVTTSAGCEGYEVDGWNGVSEGASNFGPEGAYSTASALGAFEYSGDDSGFATVNANGSAAGISRTGKNATMAGWSTSTLALHSTPAEYSRPDIEGGANGGLGSEARFVVESANAPIGTPVTVLFTTRTAGGGSVLTVGDSVPYPSWGSTGIVHVYNGASYLSDLIVLNSLGLGDDEDGGLASANSITVTFPARVGDIFLVSVSSYSVNQAFLPSWSNDPLDYIGYAFSRVEFGGRVL